MNERLKPREGHLLLPVPSRVDSSKPSISVVGMGYVGLATALCFASFGCLVSGVEIDENKLAMIQEGTSPIHEPGIDVALKNCIEAGTFRCISDTRKSVLSSAITFLTVGTPSSPDGSVDLGYIESAASEVGRAIREKKNRHLVVVKSTVPPGTTMSIVKQTLELASGKRFPQDFGICVNPEFLREGTAIQDTINTDALIVGTSDSWSRDLLLRLYKLIYGENKLPPTLVMEPSNAEFVKYSINTFRAVQLSFLNQLANLCETIPSADVYEVIKGLSAVTKVDERYLKPGFGFGGSCLPKDVRALTSIFQKNGINPTLLLAATEVNLTQPVRAVDIAQMFLGSLEGKKVAVLGLTFKANTDDVRESVAVRACEEFLSSSANVHVYDPKGIENAKKYLSNSVTYSESAASCLRGADCCLVATEWEEFRRIPPSTFKIAMRNPLVIDGRRIFDQSSFEAEGVVLYELGRNFKRMQEPDLIRA